MSGQAALNGSNGALDEARFQNLDHLLTQAGMYTQWLGEQINMLDEKAQPQESETEKTHNKRKGEKQGSGARKKGPAAKPAKASLSLSCCFALRP